MSLQLSVFGSIHFNRLPVVTRDLETFAAEADAVCVEYPRADEDPGRLLRAVLYVPCVFLGGLLAFVLLQGPAFALCNRDLRSTEYVAAERVAGDRPVHTVDTHPLFLLLDRHPAWAVGNWLLLGALAVYAPHSLAVAGGVALVGGLCPIVLQRWAGRPRFAAVAAVVAGVGAWTLLVADPLSVVTVAGLYVGFAVGAVATLSERNAAMLDDVEALADANGYETVCLATGLRHLPGIVATADERGHTVAGAFKQRWLRSGERVDPEGVSDSGSGFDHPLPAMDTAGGVLGRRAAATALDWVGVACVSGAAGVAGTAVSATVGGDPVGGFVIGALASAMVYHPIQEARYGQTLGKRVLGLVVVDTDGTGCSIRQAFVRTLCRPVDAVAFYGLGAAVVALTDGGRRVGDLLAGTTVVLTEAAADELEH